MANPIIDNSVLDPEDNSPLMVWDKLISRHHQIFLVLCGHEHGQAFRSDPNQFGHVVYRALEVLIPFRSGHAIKLINLTQHPASAEVLIPFRSGHAIKRATGVNMPGLRS